jgi:hypothetical protein
MDGRGRRGARRPGEDSLDRLWHLGEPELTGRRIVFELVTAPFPFLQEACAGDEATFRLHNKGERQKMSFDETIPVYSSEVTKKSWSRARQEEGIRNSCAHKTRPKCIS